MVSLEELRTLAKGGVAIGAHGKTHQPITAALDTDSELGGARHQLATLLSDVDPPVTMSFPHGRFDAQVVRKAHASGFVLAFTSEPCVNPVAPGPESLLGRVGFETEELIDEKLQFAPHKLALQLFLLPHRRLA